MRGAPFRSWNGGNVQEFVCPIFPYHTQGAFCMVPTKTQDLRAVIINMNICLYVSCVFVEYFVIISRLIVNKMDDGLDCR